MMAIILIRSALHSLKHRKMRSLLTMLGIIIGVVSIIAVMSIGEGAKYKVNQAIEKLGSNFILVLAAPPKSLLQRGGVNYTLRPADLQAIKEECDDVLHISPGVMIPITAVHESTNWQTSVLGTNELYPDIRQWRLVAGDFFTAQDVRAGSKVAIIGQTVLKELYKDRNPIGTIIRIKKFPFKVIGVLEEKGRSPDGRDFDDVIIIPVYTALRKLLGKNYYSAFSMSAVSKEKLDSATRQVRSILRQKHHLKERDDDDFTIFTQADIMQASEASSQVLNLLLLIIASISLIVGGIGIMNIMLVTVTERTKEIGIRMAIGATTSSILTQFIFEAMTICLIGGLMGVLLGVLAANVIGLALGWPIFISYKAIALSLCSSLLIGLFFGYYPARKASMLNPVQALIEQ